MAIPRILGITVGLAAALGGAALAARKFFGGEDGSNQYTTSGIAPASTPTSAPRREGLDPTLLEILACPDDKQPVIYQKEGDAERLTCTKCGKRYPVRDGIPVMLIDEATPGPVPSEQEITAAKAVASEGKPALVGATASSNTASGNTASGNTASSTSSGTTTPAAGTSAGSTSTNSTPSSGAPTSSSSPTSAPTNGTSSSGNPG